MVLFSGVVLKLQVLYDLELGVILGNMVCQVMLCWFCYCVCDELYYDLIVNGGFGVNSNLVLICYQGVELEGCVQLIEILGWSVIYQYINVCFEEGDNSGK